MASGMWFSPDVESPVWGAGEFWLSEEQWFRLQPLLPNKPRGVPRVDDRRAVSEIVHVLQPVCRWKDALAVCGPPEAQ